MATQTKPVGQGGSSAVPQKNTVVREQDESAPASAVANTTKRMEDVIWERSGRGKSALAKALNSVG